MSNRQSLLFPPQVPAPELETSQWFNSDIPLSLEALRGKVVALHAFQMLCPGCVSHGIPQTQRIHETFDPADVAVLGLHTVFEHHAAMQPVSLQAFLHEYRVGFPVGVDAPGDEDGIPRTMRAYELRGTPTLILIDRNGYLRYHAFGRAPDLAVGAAIAQLIGEKTNASR
ncbi:MAG: redoxin domain-containing protein [Burkholderiales bacterium]